MVVERDALRVGVDVDGGEDYVGEVDAGFLEKGEDGDGVARGGVVRLVVGYEARDMLVREGGHFALLMLLFW